MVSPQTTGPGSFATKDRDPSGMSQISQFSNSTYASTTGTGNSLATHNTGGSSSRFTQSMNGRPASRDGPPVSSWSSKKDEGRTAPAWNISQYGYMGGASQGNQGISFGGRRQITTQSPVVPNLADKERRRREEEAEMQKAKQEQEELAAKRQVEVAAEEERARKAEAEKWEQETKQQREAERKALEDERKRWEEDEKRWKAEEEQRKREEEQRKREEATARVKKPVSKPPAAIPMRSQARTPSGHILNGQMLSQYQSSDPVPIVTAPSASPSKSTEQDRIAELERQLAEAKEREGKYEEERRRRQEASSSSSDMILPTPFSLGSRGRNDGAHSEEAPEPLRSFARTTVPTHSSPLPPAKPYAFEAVASPRPLPGQPLARAANPTHSAASGRPLPDPASYRSPLPVRSHASPAISQPEPLQSTSPTKSTPSRQPEPITKPAQPWNTSSFLASNPAPRPTPSTTHTPPELKHSSTAERDAEASRSTQAAQKTKDRSWASKSLLEREMESERERQREWEAAQNESKSAAERGVGRGDGAAKIGEGGAWDVNAYGWMGGDSQNKGTLGIGAGRRQIIGPRPPPS